MPDPFLDAHRLLPSFYLLGFPVAPVSIRDQMLRGHLFVERAIRAGLLSRGKDPFVVVGAGVAGVTAAMRAVQRGIPTVLFESNSFPFPIQSGVSTRFIHPSQYDWPANHWRINWFPAPGSPTTFPLSFPAAFASKLASLWTAELNLFRGRVARSTGTRFDIHYNEKVVGITPVGGGLLQVKSNPTGGSASLPPVNAQTILWAVGFGSEQCSIGNYRSFRFWETDLHVSNPPLRHHEVVIAGAGDGALQDFIRLCTNGMSASDVYNSCSIPESIAAAIYSAEDQAHRARIWSAGRSDDHNIEENLQKVHVEQVNIALGDASLTNALSKILANCPQISLVYRCTHFSNYYGLNRFVSLLLATHLKENLYRSNVLIPGVTVRSVAGTAHTCASDPKVCHLQQHKVDLDSYLDCRSTPGTSALSITGDIVVIRYGLSSPTVTPLLAPPLSHWAGLSRTRHLLPYAIE